MMLHTKYQGSRDGGFGQEYFLKLFLQMPWQSEFFTELKSFEIPLKWDHPKIIPVKFGEIPPRSLGSDVV